MRGFAALIVFSVLPCHLFAQAPDRDFTGEWQLTGSPSNIRTNSVFPAGYLHVEQSGATMTVSAAAEEGGPLVSFVVPLDRRSVKSRVGDSTVSIATKWEGAAL